MNFLKRLSDGLLGSASPLQQALEPSRYVIQVTDSSNDVPLNESEEISYLRSTPVETVLGNHFFVLLQLAAVHLATTPPNLPAAQLVIDTIAAMLQVGGERLGEHVDLYRSALAEVQQVYVRASQGDPEL
jgi:hypothetical protein